LQEIAKASWLQWASYRMPESHSHWTFVVWPATTSTSNGP
jgi:hypothetical protein